MIDFNDLNCFFAEYGISESELEMDICTKRNLYNRHNDAVAISNVVYGVIH